MTCDKCRFSRPVAESGGPDQGYQCRRHPPQVIAGVVPPAVHGGHAGMHVQTVFPVVPAGEWCGEYQGVSNA